MVSKFVLALASLTLLGASPAFAATATSTQPAPSTVSPVTVAIQSPTIVKQEGRTFTISFKLSSSEVAPQIRYGVVLLTTKGVTVDTQVSREVVSLAAGESVAKVVTYTPPAPLEGKYRLMLEARTTNGYYLSFAPIEGEVLFAKDTKPALLIDTKSCYLTVGTATKHYTLREGVDVSAKEELHATCTVKNASSASITATPRFATYYRTLYGDKVGSADESPVTLAAGASKAITFTVPKVEKPQAYDAVLTLTSGGAVSNAAIFHWVLRGDGATIQEASLDKTYYSSGDHAQLSLYWTGSADSFPGSRAGTSTPLVNPVATISLMSGSTACADVVKVPLDKNRLTVDIPVTRACVDPKVSVAIASSDKSGGEAQLDSQQYSLTSPASGLAKTIGRILALLVIVLGLAGALYYAYKKKQLVNETSTLLIIGAIALYGVLGVGAGQINAAPYTQFVPWSPTNDYEYRIWFPSVFYRGSGKVGLTAVVTMPQNIFTSTELVEPTQIYTPIDSCSNGVKDLILSYARIMSADSDIPKWDEQYPVAGTIAGDMITELQGDHGTWFMSMGPFAPGEYNLEIRYFNAAWLTDDDAGLGRIFSVVEYIKGIGGNMSTYPCDGVQNQLCRAKIVIPFKVVENGACGTANGKTYPADAITFGPNDTACISATGNVVVADVNGTPIADNTVPFPAVGSVSSWVCKGSYSGSDSPVCSASRQSAAIAGVCGPAGVDASGTGPRVYPSGTTYPPSKTNFGPDAFCKVGSVLEPISSTPLQSALKFPKGVREAWWTCSGINGGSISSLCRAQVAQDPVCGTAAKQYPAGSTGPYPSGSTFCSVGTPAPVSPKFPTLSNNDVTWSCVIPGGDTAQCQASVPQSYPDLQASKITPTTVKAGDTTQSLSANITNFGDAATPSAGFTNVFQSGDSIDPVTGPQNVQRIGTVQVSEVLLTVIPHNIKKVSLANPFVTPGIKHVRVCADHKTNADVATNAVMDVTESDEANNCGEWTEIKIDIAVAPACTLVANPSTVASNAANKTVNLRWTTSNATSFSIDHGVGAVSPASGGNVTSPAITADTRITGTATGAGGNRTCYVDISVTAPPVELLPDPVVHISASPDRVKKDTGITTITWSAENVTGCNSIKKNGLTWRNPNGTPAATPVVDQVTHTVPTSPAQSHTDTISSQTVYTIECWNDSHPPPPYEIFSKSVTVDILPIFQEF